MVLNKLTQQWQSRTVRLTNTPAATPIQSLTAPPASGWYFIDVTSLYNGWRSGNPSTLNYGLKLVPNSTNNKFDTFRSSAFYDKAFRPRLVVSYTPQPADNVIKLKWPLGAVPRAVNYGFGQDWTAYSTKCPGVRKLHNGTDYTATAGKPVYAAEDGVIREVTNDPRWGHNIVLEHASPRESGLCR